MCGRGVLLWCAVVWFGGSGLMVVVWAKGWFRGDVGCMWGFLSVAYCGGVSVLL